MNSNLINQFLIQNAGSFDEMDVPRIAQGLAMVPDENALYVVGADYKRPDHALVFSLVGGFFGVDRFFLGQTGLAIAKLLTCGGFGIWVIIDIFLIMNETKSVNSNKIVDMINQYATKTQRPPVSNSTSRKSDDTNFSKEVESVDFEENNSKLPDLNVPSVRSVEDPMNYAPKSDDFSRYAPKSDE